MAQSKPLQPQWVNLDLCQEYCLVIEMHVETYPYWHVEEGCCNQVYRI